MTEIWSAPNIEKLQPPRSVDEAMNRLLLIMNDSELLAACGAWTHSDDVSGIIVRALCERLPNGEAR
ncbi:MULTISPECIES: hypothetical protein [Methylomonas]|uniref:hypothetical protein n=1 Tax=Methylomonas TaxID=416 RepID=UPI000A7DF3F1|nr:MULTISPECIES: hypothetical protein [Methylomonas]